MKQKLKSMDIIKGIGIIMIIIVHNRHFLMLDMSGLRPLMNYGQMGCQLFFFVSGFTLCYAWEHLSESSRRRRRAPKLLRFYLRRYLRLAPGFLLFMLLHFGLNILLLDVLSFPPGFIMNRELPGILTNVFFIHGLFPDYINSVFPGGWYIGTAFLLYLTFPFLYGLFRRLRRIHPLCMAVLPILLLVLNVFLLGWIADLSDQELYLDNNTFLYFFFTNHLPCFSLGIMLFFQEKNNARFCSRFPLAVSALLFAATTGFGIYWFLNPASEKTFALLPSLVGLSAYFLAVSLIHIEHRRNTLRGKKQQAQHENPITGFLAQCGRNSYGMYLAHPLVCWYGMKTLNYFLTENNGTYNDLLLYGLLLVPSVFIVFVLGLYVEKLLTWIDHILRRS